MQETNGQLPAARRLAAALSLDLLLAGRHLEGWLESLFLGCADAGYQRQGGKDYRHKEEKSRHGDS
jgi:hypothetical protein